jgi:hypothetical protein
VFWVSSKKVRETLINVGEAYNLDKVVEVVQSYKYSQQKLKLMSTDAENSVQAVYNGKTGQKGSPSYP